MAGYGRYYWRGFVDKTNGNYLVIFALPTIFHQGERYCYYPSQTRTAGAITQKYAYAIGRHAFTNVFREFWRDIAMHVLHRNP